MIPHIIVIEDDNDILQFLKELLGKVGFTVKGASTGIAGLKLIEKTPPDLVLLDLTLPDMQGESICLDVRKNYPHLPVIMLTAKDTIADKIKGLGLGADDYMTKPFVADELIARIKARLRGTMQHDAPIRVADLELDPRKVEVRRGEKHIALTPQEFKLLEYLITNKGMVLTRDMILNRIWLYSPDVESRVVDVYMGYLRKKVDRGFKKKLLHSVRGFGYTIHD